MPKRRHRVVSCLSCCARGQMLSDDEQGFDDIRPRTIATQRVVEVPVGGDRAQAVNPPVSRGSPPKVPQEEAPPPAKAEPVSTDVIGDGVQKVSIGNREVRSAGDVLVDLVDSSDEEESVVRHQKVVTFAICHEPYVKDTRDNYRATPKKEKASYAQEYFFVKESDGDAIIQVPLAELKNFVTDYVRKIMKDAYASVLEEDFPMIADDVNAGDIVKEKEDAGSMSTDDGIDLSSEECEAIGDMVDGMLLDLKTQLANELKETLVQKAAPTEPPIPQPTESRDGSSSDVSTLTSESVQQVDSTSSLDWDGYTPLLREDPSYTDVTATAINCPQVSARNIEQ